MQKGRRNEKKRGKAVQLSWPKLIRSARKISCQAILHTTTCLKLKVLNPVCRFKEDEKTFRLWCWNLRVSGAASTREERKISSINLSNFKVNGLKNGLHLAKFQALLSSSQMFSQSASQAGNDSASSPRPPSWQKTHSKTHPVLLLS